ncbi:tetratricopeptide repeat protein [Ekhidna sp.]|uniref:tetratricopeptide repeat protein n=1 Tax=Ekhidna sp. TaxID=2608089 RepID=UPI003B5C7FC0
MIEEEKILKYLRGLMSESEQLEFESRLSNNKELEEFVEHSRRIMQIVDSDTQAFGQVVRSVINTKKENKSWSPIWIAASILMIISFASYYLFVPTPTLNQLVENYLEPYPDVVTNRSDEQKPDLTSYNRGEYQEAIDVLQYSLDNNQLVVSLYLGVSYLMINENEQALEILNSVPFEDTQFEDDFLWYQSLALIRIGNANEARNRLEKLNRGSSNYKSKSSILLDNLRE